MRLPNANRAIVDRPKIVDYLLDEKHEDGRGKAQFFIQFGFSPETPEVLAQALLDLAWNCEVASIQPSPHGTKYVIIGLLKTPNGGAPVVKTVWMIDTGREAPRLITAVPSRRPSA